MRAHPDGFIACWIAGKGSPSACGSIPSLEPAPPYPATAVLPSAIRLPDSLICRKRLFRKCSKKGKLRKFREICLHVVGIEGSAVEKPVAAECQSTLRRTHADRLVESALKL